MKELNHSSGPGRHPISTIFDDLDEEYNLVPRDPNQVSMVSLDSNHYENRMDPYVEDDFFGAHAHRECGHPTKNDTRLRRGYSDLIKAHDQ